jgi:hypothetical protein
VTFLLALFALVPPLRARVPETLPRDAFRLFLVASVGVGAWHGVEHSVIISNVLRNGGCPCPGIVDAALGIPDTVLHFIYNTIEYVALVVPFRYVRSGPTSRQGRVTPAW